MFNNGLQNFFLLFLRYYAIIKAKLEIYLHRVNHWLTNTSSDKTSNSNWFIQKYSRFITGFNVICSDQSFGPVPIRHHKPRIPFHFDPPDWKKTRLNNKDIYLHFFLNKKTRFSSFLTVLILILCWCFTLLTFFGGGDKWTFHIFIWPSHVHIIIS